MGDRPDLPLIVSWWRSRRSAPGGLDGWPIIAVQRSASTEVPTVGDYDYGVQENAAQHDLQDAANLQADATTLHQEAAADYTQANAADQMGAGAEGQVLRATGDVLEGRASDFDDRAGHLQHSAELQHQAADVLRERDTAAAGATAAEIHAEGAQVVMDFVDLSEQDRTRWLGEQGAATGEAGALHTRADDLTEQGVALDQAAGAERNAARDGLQGRQWTGTGQPPSGPTTPSGAE